MEQVTGGVILCAGRKSDVDESYVTKLTNRYRAFAINSFSNFDGTAVFPVVETGNTVDGGNGGGGEGATGMRFVAGTDRVGVWNFRYLPGVPTKVGDKYSLAEFPEAGRIELCIYVEDIADAAVRLSDDLRNDGLRFLSKIFNYVMLIPFSIPTKKQGQLIFIRPTDTGPTVDGLAVPM